MLKQLVPPSGNICAIGDPDQAIYGFRGADVRFFTRFQDDFPNAQIVRLKRNYRSNRNIVDLSSQVMAQVGARQQSIPTLSDDPNRITLHEATTERAEAEFVVQSIEQLLGGHSFFSIDSGRTLDHAGDNLSFADIAVLYRTEALAPALIEALQRSGMPFQHHSHHPFMRQPYLSRLIDMLRQDQQNGSLRERLEAVTARLQVAEPVVSAQEIMATFERIKPVAEACGADLERFLATLALNTQVDTWDPRADRISLLTLHAAKGLEFPVVFILGCEAGILPLTWGKPVATDVDDEERRLFYVGITRAKTRLYLCHAKTRLWHGRIQQMTPSPYLAEVEEKLLKRQRSRLPNNRTRQHETQLKLL